jgi:uncharacterized protein (TIGR02118 family)
MAALVVVVYPRPDGELKFDMTYYLEKHMPLVSKLWGALGLKSWTVTEAAEGPYAVSAALSWESHDASTAATTTPAGTEIFADVANFTDIKPELIKSTVKGHWTA